MNTEKERPVQQSIRNKILYVYFTFVETIFAEQKQIGKAND